MCEQLQRVNTKKKFYVGTTSQTIVKVYENMRYEFKVNNTKIHLGQGHDISKIKRGVS